MRVEDVISDTDTRKPLDRTCFARCSALSRLANTPSWTPHPVAGAAEAPCDLAGAGAAATAFDGVALEGADEAAREPEVVLSDVAGLGVAGLGVTELGVADPGVVVTAFVTMGGVEGELDACCAVCAAEDGEKVAEGCAASVCPEALGCGIAGPLPPVAAWCASSARLIV